ncbi:MAG: 30S ribosomal protein S27ae [Nanoarchaeota archaeon]|nr:30S ribosomal protein S27ae [Nanoarchaeota archaeon]
MGKKKRAKEKKGKKKPRKTKSAKKWELYEVKDGKVKRKNKICPKCGPGVFMAKHKNRWACGRCGYTEMIKA